MVVQFYFHNSKVPDAFQKLIDSVESTMRHAIVEEEHISFETVTNFDEVLQCGCTLIKCHF